MDNVILIGRGVAHFNHPFWIFSCPHRAVSGAKMDLYEKCAIPSARASHVHAAESVPALRHLPGTPFPVTFSSIKDARIVLDRLSGASDGDSPSRPTVGGRLSPREPLLEAA
ncbi:MAG: hypothetical protein J0I19_07595 [Alphaproteobacteria bacterium]|nr:hypothetical protein [Alphaproteobacteria bacterium]